MCDATLSPGPNCYTDVRPVASHRQTLITHRAYIEACARQGVEVSTILQSPGTKLHHTTVDSMHAGDTGIFPDAMGSLFWLHISDKRKYRNAAVGPAALNKTINQYYAANRDRKLTRVTPLQMTQIKGKTLGYPYLKVSAAGCRHLGDFALALAYEHLQGSAEHDAFRFPRHHRLASQSDDHNLKVVECFEGLVQFQRSCSASPFAEEDCKAGMYQFLQSFIYLHDLWRREVPEAHRGTLPFHSRPKAHMLQHLVEDKIALFGSPSTFWCYGDEDYMGAIKSVCASSKHPATLERRVGEKCQIAAGITVYEAGL